MLQIGDGIGGVEGASSCHSCLGGNVHATEVTVEGHRRVEPGEC